MTLCSHFTRHCGLFFVTIFETLDTVGVNTGLPLYGDTYVYSSFQTGFPAVPRSHLAFWSNFKWLRGK